MYDRKLLAKLSTCGWNVINTFLKSASSHDDAVPGASISVHTYGDFLNFNPYLHAIVSDGCFRSDGSFQMPPGFDPDDLEEVFQYEVLKMLKKEGKSTMPPLRTCYPGITADFMSMLETKSGPMMNFGCGQTQSPESAHNLSSHFDQA
jgi:hypothetical protein